MPVFSFLNLSLKEVTDLVLQPLQYSSSPGQWLLNSPPHYRTATPHLKLGEGSNFPAREQPLLLKEAPSSLQVRSNDFVDP